MFKIRIQPHWLVEDERTDLRQALPRLLDLLALIHSDGNLARACRELGVSYRYAWGLIRRGAKLFGSPLVQTAKGQGTRLTGLGERLLWADRRIHARLAPILDSLASELEVEIQQALTRKTAALRIHASHGFAVEALRTFLLRREIPIELKYRGSLEALASVCQSTCELAGFHVPIGELQGKALLHYSAWLKPKGQRLINLATRRQGIIVERSNPYGILSVADLMQPGIRFVNRQLGSGTRMLVDLLLKAESLDGRQIAGYDTGEFTHAAVAAYIASGMADAGFGVETAARQFNLGFVPIVSERYFLIADAEALGMPAVKQVLEILASKEFKAHVNNIPGYDAAQCGRIEAVEDAFPQLAAIGRRKQDARRRGR